MHSTEEQNWRLQIANGNTTEAALDAAMEDEVEYVGPMRLDHIGSEQSPEFPVRCTSRETGSIEWVTMEYAVNRLNGYYAYPDRDPDIEKALRLGGALQTISFIYQMG